MLLNFVVPTLFILQIVFLHSGFSFTLIDNTNTKTLRFKVSARSLPDKDIIGTTDPYLKIKYTEGEQKEPVFLGKTAVFNDLENPDWGEIFEFEYDKAKKPRWYFTVYDRDGINKDDTVGSVWVTVEDYVKSHQYTQVNLNKKGYLIIQKV